MRKLLKLAMIFIAGVLLLSGCSSSNTNESIRKRHDSKKDTIKFFNLDWLVDVNTVKKALADKYGNDFAMEKSPFYTKYGDNYGRFQYYIQKNPSIYNDAENNNEPLLWDMNGFTIKSLTFQFVNDSYVMPTNAKENELYLYIATIDFVLDSEKAKELKKELDKIYGNGNAKNSKNYVYVWKDENGNTLELAYSDGNKYASLDRFYLEYSCNDVLNYLEKEKEQYNNNQQKENSQNSLF